MSKYIIDTDQFEKLFETKAVAVLGIGDNPAVPEEGEKTVWTRMLNVADLEELNSDYINEHFGDLQDTAYQKGLDEAWKAARRISVIELNGGLAGKELMKIYGTTYIHKIYDDNTASEAIAKMKAYEEKQKADDKIEVGDEVEWTGDKYIVTYINYDIDTSEITDYDLLGDDGSVADHVKKCSFTKTGRHFDIQKILEDMRND